MQGGKEEIADTEVPPQKQTTTTTHTKLDFALAAARARLWHCTFILLKNQKWNEFSLTVKGGSLMFTELTRLHTIFLEIMQTNSWDFVAAMFMEPTVTLHAENLESQVNEFRAKYDQPFGTVPVSTKTWGDAWARYHFLKTGGRFVECDIFDEKNGVYIVKCRGENDLIHVTLDDLACWGAVATLNLDHPRLWQSSMKTPFFGSAVALFATMSAQMAV